MHSLDIYRSQQRRAGKWRQRGGPGQPFGIGGGHFVQKRNITQPLGIQIKELATAIHQKQSFGQGYSLTSASKCVLHTSQTL